MDGISNVSGTVSNTHQNSKTRVKQQQDNFKKSAFNSYKEFKQRTQNEFDSFKEQALREFNAFKNNASPDTTQAQQYVKAVVVNHVMDHKPAYYNESQGELVQGQVAKDPLAGLKDVGPAYYEEEQPEIVKSQKDTDPVVNVKDAEPVEEKLQDVNIEHQKTTEPVQMKNISRKGVSGGYSLRSAKDGKGFLLVTDMTVSGRGEASKFFTMNSEKGNELYKDEKTGEYVFRGIQHHRLSFLQTRMDLASQKVSINNAVYNDLLTKQNSGTDLTDAEKLFMKSHIESLEKYGLGLDDDGNLINTLEE